MHIYQIEPLDHRIEKALETMRQRIASSGMGVTLQGNRLTIRFNTPDLELLDIHMVILEVKSEVLDAEEKAEIDPH